MAGRYDPYFLNTEADRGGIVAVVTLTFVTVATCANIIRFWTRRRKDGALGLDDALLVAANVSVDSNKSMYKGLWTREINCWFNPRLLQWSKAQWSRPVSTMALEGIWILSTMLRKVNTTRSV